MVLRKRLLLLSVLKSVELPYVFKEMVIKLFFFLESYKEQHLFKIDIFGNIINAFTVKY